MKDIIKIIELNILIKNIMYLEQQVELMININLYFLECLTKMVLKIIVAWEDNKKIKEKNGFTHNCVDGKFE